MAEYEASNKIEFFDPWPHQQRIIDYFHGGKKTILAEGANRIGKTVIGTCLTGAVVYGIQPWDKKPSPFGKGAKKVRIVCTDWDHHAKEVIVPALQEWFPKGTYETRKNNQGVDAFWTFNNGSTIELLTNMMDPKQAEGWKGHFVWFDEPPERDMYIANIRGLIDYGGIAFISMTAVTGPWILDEIALNPDPSIGCVTDIPMRANPLLSDESIRSFGEKLTEEERKVRIDGGWLSLTGLICKEFNRDVHIIKPMDIIPRSWPVEALIDIHPSKPQAVGFYTTDERGFDYVIGEIHQHADPEKLAYLILEKIQSNRWNCKRAFIDPLSKGDSAYMRNRMDVEDTFNIIERILRTRGIILETATKDKDSGIINIKRKLKSLNNLPALFFFNTCERHIYEIQRWVYDPKTGKPSKENDDMMENLYRSTLTGRRYIDEAVFARKSTPRVVDAMAGY